jgi:hypothetical protein
MKNYKGKLFLTVGEATSFVSGEDVMDWTGTCYNSIFSKYENILASELTTYIYLDGLHKYQIEGDGEITTLHMEGFCTQIDYPQGYVYEVGDYLDVAMAFSIGDERIIDVDPHPTQYVTLTELYQYQLSTGFKLNEVNFEKFFNEALGVVRIALAEQFVEENEKTDKISLIEKVKEDCYFSYLINTFGEKYKKVANQALLSFLERDIAIRSASAKNSINERGATISNANLSDELVVNYPEYLKLTMSFYEDVWFEHPIDMKNPTRAQLELYLEAKLEDKGFKSTSKLLYLIISLSKPDNFNFGGKQLAELGDWVPKSKREKKY